MKSKEKRVQCYIYTKFRYFFSFYSVFNDFAHLIWLLLCVLSLPLFSIKYFWVVYRRTLKENLWLRCNNFTNSHTHNMLFIKRHKFAILNDKRKKKTKERERERDSKITLIRWQQQERVIFGKVNCQQNKQQ